MTIVTLHSVKCQVYIASNSFIVRMMYGTYGLNFNPYCIEIYRLYESKGKKYCIML